jgi:S-formylglutathione hydrolase FrmB
MGGNDMDKVSLRVSSKRLALILLGITMFLVILASPSLAASSVTTESHSSTVLNRTMNFNVYLPPSYSSNMSKYYPVLYLLHGMNGSFSDWKSAGMQSIVDNVSGKEMVIIMPDGFNSFYMDGYQSGIKYETYLHNELIPYVESKYRIDAANGKNRAIAGLSMGGYGATYHGFKYPEKFSAAYSMSGALEVGGTVDITTVINKNKYPGYVMECGTEDTLVGQMNASFHQKLQSAGITHEYITRSGSHSMDFWIVCLPKTIVFVSKYFTEEAAKPGDINGDGNIDSTDSSLLQRHLLGLSTGISNAADMNSDGVINSTDAAMLKRALLS